MSLIGSDTFAWEEEHKCGNVMYRLPRNIRFNDNIVVREDEVAVFFRDGKVIDMIDMPGRYALTSINAPIVGRVVKALTGVEQRAEVIYLQKRVLDGKYGSLSPYQFRDRDFGYVTLRVFGEFRYRVESPEVFVNVFVGSFDSSTAEEVEERIKAQMVALIYNSIGVAKEKGLGVVDLSANIFNIEQLALSKAESHFSQYGLRVEKVSGLNINVPSEVQRAVDTRSSMQILKADYLQFQSGNAMREAAQNPAGRAAGAGVGIGAGIGLGSALSSSVFNRTEAPGMRCPLCGANMPGGARFCPSCGHSMEERRCPHCGVDLPSNAKYCMECGKRVDGERKCPECGKEVPMGAKYCPECGTRMEEE